MPDTGHMVGMLLLGMAVGKYLAVLPEPVAIIDPYITYILVGLAILIFIKG